MKNVINILIVIIVLTSSTCLAMSFSQPVKIGIISGTPQGGFGIDGASYNKGTSYKNGQLDKQWGKLYEKGIAYFGNDDKALYVHYDCSQRVNRDYWEVYSPKFGDKNAKKTVSLKAGEGETVTIYQINNDGDIILYLLRGEGPVAGTTNYVLLGRRSDGIFVKYFDTRDITKNYFGEKLSLSSTPWYTKFYCQDNTMIIEYKRSYNRQGYVREGEFRFKWDNNAQWFGVEQIIY